MSTLSPKLPWDHTYAANLDACSGYQSVPTDPDAIDYLTRVAAADGAAVEVGVAMAVDAFVKGCKADSTWDAIQASCILCGARTLSGALVPLKGDAPTPYNFVEADYNRSGVTPGLLGDGATKYLDTNRASDADGQNDSHWAVFPTVYGTAGQIIGTRFTANAADSNGFYFAQAPSISAIRSRAGYDAGTDQSQVVTFAPGELVGGSRSSAAGFTKRYNGLSQPATMASHTPDTSSYHVLRREDGANYSDARLAFYSIGSSLDLAALDDRVTNLVNGIKFYTLTGLVATDYDPDTVAYIVAAYEAGGTL